MKIIIITIIALGIFSNILAFIIYKTAHRHRIIAKPNERSSHSIPTPTGGGIAIVISWYIGITIFYFLGLIESSLFYALLSGIILAIVSFMDDIYELRPLIRLPIHFFTAIIALYFLNGLRPFILSGQEMTHFQLYYPFVIIGMVWFINLYNFMDGIDGIASLEAIIISLIIFVFSRDIITILLISCISGFLFWNWPKAKIFMGDVGSIQLGFILVVIGIHFHNEFKLSILNWIMIASPFWFDATYTLFKRWRNKEKLSSAHKKHAYQRIVQYGFSQQKTLFILIMIELVIFSFILIYREFGFLKIPLILLTLTGLFTLYRIVDRLIPFNIS